MLLKGLWGAEAVPPSVPSMALCRCGPESGYSETSLVTTAQSELAALQRLLEPGAAVVTAGSEELVGNKTFEMVSLGVLLKKVSVSLQVISLSRQYVLKWQNRVYLVASALSWECSPGCWKRDGHGSEV